ncbi:MAG: DUF445 family protein [Muribaculaceae bacterium]|nr:DUF445 family protein [Muribaculaceae bacterium]
MNAILEYISGPALGAVIGYITNDIAIRMLFRPRTAKYIFGMHVPFTPGIIPKEKDRIAGAIGNSISENLMNKEVLEKTLLSDEMLEKIRAAIDEFFYTQLHNDETLEQFASHYLTEQEIGTMRESTCDEIAKLISAKLRDHAIGKTIAHAATQHVIDKTRNSMAGKIHAERLIEAVSSPIETKLAQHINEVLQEQAPSMSARIVYTEADKLTSMPMCELFKGHEQQLEQAREGIMSVYRTLISDHLPRILESINISKIVESRIQEMDMEEAEQIIISVMKKELRAIVWLGAFLGCIMGTIMTVINI